MSSFAGTQMATHSQFQTVKHVMGKQTAQFIDGTMVASLMMKVNTNAMIQKVSYFFCSNNFIAEHQYKT